MNGDIVCSSRSVSLLGRTKSISQVQVQVPVQVPVPVQDGRLSPQFLQQSDAIDPTPSPPPPPSDTASDFSQRSLSWSDEVHCPALRPPPELPRPLSNSLSNNNNNNNNNNRQRRGVRLKVKGKKSTLRIAGGKNSQNRKVTDFYPIRRSSRKSKTELKCEEKKAIDDLITKGIEEGMEVRHMEGKGRAVFATRCFQKGEFVVEYHGDLLNINDAKTREAEYSQNPNTGCYMYYFQFLCKTYCVDATRESGRLGRLINHSKAGNLQTKLHAIGGVPHLILVASRRIEDGEELLYDYGDRSKASIDAHPWLKH